MNFAGLPPTTSPPNQKEIVVMETIEIKTLYLFTGHQ